ncbi:hypothetical protein FGIG_04019 [Fasciola gigantica]|uniref:MH2 domain-containing protein n=1 Tax=Fasciola gigantica TaxID=46835 RepID=A0A504Z8P4_FASGI|nr:hypothetical protein FGIG_04019 [Fasciola gigantica]
MASDDQDCATDSTILLDSSLAQCGGNWNDSRSPTTTGRASSTSTSGTEEFSARSKPKKPRPLVSCRSQPQNSVSPTSVAKPWASLSFWEETKHIGQRWFSLTGPVVRVVYDVGDTEDWDSASIPSDPIKSCPSQPSFPRRRRRRGISVGGSTGSSTHFICLSRLVNRTRCSSSSSKLWIQPPNSSQCTVCSDYAQPTRDKHVSATQGRRLSTSSLSALFPGNSPIKRSSSWRQCYRLGNQGIVFHVTATGRVWIDNQTLATNLPLFVSSSFFIRNATSPFSDWPVYRVPAGCSILVFDQLAHQNARPEVSIQLEKKHPARSDRPLPLRDCTQNAPVVHVSLGKGWGPTYRRPDLTHCPARLELWINVEHLCKVVSCQA